MKLRCLSSDTASVLNGETVETTHMVKLKNVEPGVFADITLVSSAPLPYATGKNYDLTITPEPEPEPKV